MLATRVMRAVVYGGIGAAAGAAGSKQIVLGGMSAIQPWSVREAVELGVANPDRMQRIVTGAIGGFLGALHGASKVV